MPGTDNINPIKFGYTDKDTLPASFTNEYPSYIVLNTKKNSIMFKDTPATGEAVTGEILGGQLNMSSLTTMTGNEPTWNSQLGYVTA